MISGRQLPKLKSTMPGLQITYKFEKILLNFNDKLSHKKITINTDGKLVFLEPDDILYAESDGNYATLFLQNNKRIVLTKN